MFILKTIDYIVYLTLQQSGKKTNTKIYHCMQHYIHNLYRLQNLA